MFTRRPRFTPDQAALLRTLIYGELEYLGLDVPGICLFRTDEEAAALLDVIEANR